jgi:hypothetical protein
MKTSLTVALLVCAIAGTVVHQAAGQSAGGPGAPIKDPVERSAYVSAIQQTDPAQKAHALEAFLRTYPDSAMKEMGLLALMTAYQQAGDAQQMIDTAARVLQANPKNTVALSSLAFYYGRTKYIRYHGSENGWAAVVRLAQADPGMMPPAGFTVTKGKKEEPL